MFRYIITEGVVPTRYAIDENGNIFDYALSRYITQRISKNGYKCVQLASTSNTVRTYLVHTLVMDAFCICKKVGDDVIRHIDGNKLNNNIYNLKYISSEANQKEMSAKYTKMLNIDKNTVVDVQDGNYKNTETKGNALLTDEQIHEACHLMSRGMNYKQILWTMGLPDTQNLRGVLSRIKSHKAYTEISSQYNLPEVKSRAEAIKLDNATVENICNMIARGASDDQICYMYRFHPFNRKMYDKFKKIVNNIRMKKTYVNISDKYF
jgi:hypothetical protein